MIQYPEFLHPTSIERIDFVAFGGHVDLPKTVVQFRLWRGESRESYGGKALLDWNGECTFAELAILREFEQAGWDGRWVDGFGGGKLRVGYWDNAPIKELPLDKARLLESVGAAADSPGGCFDIFCWRGDQVCFAEAKHSRKDRIRDSQVRWLRAALKVGLGPEQLLVVEWTAV